MAGLKRASEAADRRTIEHPQQLASGSREEAPQGLLLWLARVCREERIRAGLSPEEMALVCGLSNNVFRRFEKAMSWPRDSDYVIGVYAYLCGISDARVLWRRAQDLWEQDGEVPPEPVHLKEAVRLLELRRRSTGNARS